MNDRATHARNSLLLPTVVLLSGAAAMSLELVGSRLLAPFFGNSIFVWTSLIGVMLGFMALGNYLGGRLADRLTSPDILFWIMVVLSLSISVVAIVESWLLGLFALNDSVRMSMVTSSMLLFCIPCTLFGMVTPATIRLRLQNLKTSGANVGGLYALSTVGSIVGTFATGFWLLAVVGSSQLLGWLAVLILLLASCLAFPVGSNRLKKVGALLLALLFVIAAFFWHPQSTPMEGLRTFDTAYDRYVVGELTDAVTGRSVRFLSHNPWSIESAVFADNYEPYLLDYYHYYDMALDIAPEPRSTLLIGGGAFVYPRHQLTRYPGTTIDVVEIDSALEAEAEKYFGFVPQSTLTLYFEDGRMFLNRTSKRYDAVILDAFKSSNNVPYQLTTKESMQRCYDVLNNDGVLVMNLIGSLEGPGGRFLKAQYHTLREVFPQVELYLVASGEQPEAPQNISLIALKGSDKELASALAHANGNLAAHRITIDASDAFVLTDDFAPVDQLLLGVNK